MTAFDFGQVWSVCPRVGQTAVIVVILVVNQICLSGTGLKSWVKTFPSQAQQPDQSMSWREGYKAGLSVRDSISCRMVFNRNSSCFFVRGFFSVLANPG